MRAVRRSVHPLLLEPTYWRNRLRALELELAGPLLTPRPDLSGNGREVVEFRVRAHDGTRLWGLFCRPTDLTGPFPATIRSVGPADQVAPSQPAGLNAATPNHGVAEFIFQEPAGRRLEDRVLDVMRICRVASSTQEVDGAQVELADDGKVPDEFLIVEHLKKSHLC